MSITPLLIQSRWGLTASTNTSNVTNLHRSRCVNNFCRQLVMTAVRQYPVPGKHICSCWHAAPFSWWSMVLLTRTSCFRTSQVSIYAPLNTRQMVSKPNADTLYTIVMSNVQSKRMGTLEETSEYFHSQTTPSQVCCIFAPRGDF